MANFIAGILVIFLYQINLGMCYPDCHNLPSNEGGLIKTFNLQLVGLLYPNSFKVILKPEKECFYVSNNYVKLDWDSDDIDG